MKIEMVPNNSAHTQKKSGNRSDARLFMDSSSRAPRKLSVSSISCPVRLMSEPLHKRETWTARSVRPSYADLHRSLAGSNWRTATLGLLTLCTRPSGSEYDGPLWPHSRMRSQYTRRPIPSGDGANIVCLEIKQSAPRYLTKLPHDLPIDNRRGMRLTCYKPQSLLWAD